MMTRAYRDIIRHSAVYGMSQIIMRVMSVAMLPLYSRQLTPADYGTIALLDLAASVLGIVATGGFGSAAARYHFEQDDERGRDRVWWTGLALITALCTVVVVPGLLRAQSVSRVLIGDEPRGASYVILMLLTIWVNVVTNYVAVYFRVQKWSGLTLVVSTARLLLNVALNVYFLVALHWGITGVLAGNLISGVVVAIVFVVVMMSTRGRFVFDTAIARHMWAFGWPLIFVGFFGMITHQADRYLLRVLSNLHDVGIYSMAYQIGQGVTFLVQIPFQAIWGVVIYEVAPRPDREKIYTRVFRYYIYGLSIVLLAVSMFAREIINLLVAPAYAAAAELIPIVCLAYFFYSLHDHFSVPALVAKRTRMLPPVYAHAAILNILLNVWLIPRYGNAGAAWASVASFASFAVVGLMSYRRVEKYAYPFAACGTVVTGMVITYLVVRRSFAALDHLSPLVVPAVAGVAWSIALFGPLVVSEWQNWVSPRRLAAPLGPADGRPK